MSDAITRLNAALSSRYAIEREIGEGGMATVYLAEDLKHERQVALKVLKPELAAAVGAERFLAEIKTTANLQHPHILALFDSGEVDEFLFYVMPYVEGESLQQRLEREKQLPVDDAVRIATEVAEALEYAHGRGVIHRDIKPANILLQDGRVVVADFGIALAVSAAGGARLTEAGLSMGTPLYMSPEQATGDRDLDGRSDLYSLACITYEMLAGDPPYAASTAQAILSRILTEDPKPLSEARTSVPSHVEAAVHRALQRLPADRPRTAASFAEDLRTARAVPWTAALSAHTRPWMIPAGLTIALLGLVGTGWLVFGGGLGTSTSIRQSVAVMPCTDSSAPGVPTPLTQGFAEGIINGLAQLPDPFKVTGLASVIELLAQNADIETIAERLGVATVLECSLQRVGETVRVRTQLVEAATSAVLWSAEITGPADDPFEMQNSVARAVTDELQVTLAGGTETPLVIRETAVAEAHLAYQRGRFLWNQRTQVSLLNAIVAFQEAVDLDENYAQAYSGLADSYLIVDSYSATSERQNFRTNLQRGGLAARTAVSLAPDLSMARASLGFSHWTVGEWASAEQEFERAIDLAPGYPTARHWYSILLWTTGRASQGVSLAQQALELDPISRVISRDLGKVLQYAGMHDEAVEQYRQTTDLAPRWPGGWFQFAIGLLEVGKYQEGLEAWLTSERLLDGDVQGATEAYEAVVRHAQTGDPETFPDYDALSYYLNWLYAKTGQPDLAIEFFRDLVAQGAYGFVALNLVQLGLGDVHRDDPLYQELREDAGITW